MRATIHVIPAAGVDAEAHAGARRCGSGIATAALQTAERFGSAADLVLVAVPAGQGPQLAAYLQGARGGPRPEPFLAERAARYELGMRASEGLRA